MSFIIRSNTRFLSTPIQRDPDRWLYKKVIESIKCFIENRQNAYGNYFDGLKCQSKYSPEGPCYLNKFEKFNVEQTYKLYQQIQKLLNQPFVRQHSSFIQSLIDAHRKAKNDRIEYREYIQSLDNGHELKPFHKEASIIRLEKMRAEYRAALLRKHQEELNIKKAEREARHAARKLKHQQMQKQLREKIDADKRTLATFPNVSESPTEPTATSKKTGEPTTRKPKNKK